MFHQQFLWTGCKEWGKFLVPYFMAEEHPEELHLQTFSLVMQMLLRGDKLLKTEVLFHDFSLIAFCQAAQHTALQPLPAGEPTLFQGDPLTQYSK